MAKADYKIEHWTTAVAEVDYQRQAPKVVRVDDRAATREAIIQSMRSKGIRFVSSSTWKMKKPAMALLDRDQDWHYRLVAIHQAGRSFRCGVGISQMREVEDIHVRRNGWPDVGYHYGVDCTGQIFEGTDIRLKGSHLYKYNTGAIGIVLLENLSEPEDGHDYIALGLGIAKKLGLMGEVLIPQAQQSALRDLIEVLRKFFNITVLGGHIEFPGQKETDEGRLCPGTHGLRLVAGLREWSKLEKP